MNKSIRNLFYNLIIFIIILTTISLSVVNATESKTENYSNSYTIGSNQADNIVAVAQAQLGKTKAQLGYTEAWCADFVSDCAKLAGLSNIIPAAGYCGNLYTNIRNAGGYEVSSPQRGDIVFYYCNASYCPNSGKPWVHVGIMTNSSNSIEGNYGGKVSSVNGSYTDANGHTLSSGTITRKFLRPNYTSGSNPIGTVDGVVGGYNSVTVSGWAFDADNTSAQLNIHVYIDGVCHSVDENNNAIVANVERVDVNNAYGCGNYHGFSAKISTNKTGTQTVYVYAINVGGGSNVLIGSGTVNIQKDTTAPEISDVKISDIDTAGYTVTCTVKDNIELKEIRFPTWTVDFGDNSGQDDITWDAISLNGTQKTVSYRVNIEAHNGELGNYTTHMYLDDVAGNTKFYGVAVHVPEKNCDLEETFVGSITGVGSKKALTVDDSNNLFISTKVENNLKQLFEFTKYDDGTYKIKSLYNNMCIDLPNASAEKAVAIKMHTDNETPAQKWNIYKRGDYYMFRAECTPFVADVPNNVSTDGTSLQTCHCNGGVAQLFSIEKQKYLFNGKIESPAESDIFEGDDIITISGYACAEEEISNVQIRVNSAIYAVDRFDREDIQEKYPDTIHGNEGFSITLPKTAFKHGDNTANIIVDMADGSAHEIGHITFTVYKSYEPVNVGYYNGKIYAVYEDVNSWTEAKEFCEARGGNLAAITTKAEQTYITSLLNSNSVAQYWIGATRGSSDTYSWVTSETFAYNNWNTGEPNNYGETENCAVMLSNGKWNDEDDYSPYPVGFVYEFDTNSLDVSQYSTFGESEYYLYNKSVPYAIAEKYAEINGGAVLNVNSAEEENIIIKMLQNTNGEVNRVWLSLNDKDNEGIFKWDNNEPVNYTNWYEGQPNNNFGIEDYTLLITNGTIQWWNDVSADYVYKDAGFVIKYSTDINLSGINDKIDAAMLLRHISGIEALTDDQYSRADINADGNVDMKDVIYILNNR